MRVTEEFYLGVRVIEGFYLGVRVTEESYLGVRVIEGFYLGVRVREDTAASSQGSPSSPCSTSNLVAPSAMNFGLWQISCNITKTFTKIRTERVA